MKLQWRSLTYRTKLMILCSAANFINSADRVLMPLALVPMAKEFHWTLTQQGWILSAFAIGYFASQIIGANAAVKYGGKWALGLAVFLWSLSTLLTPYSAIFYPILISARLLLGLGEGLGLPTIFQLFGQHIAPTQRSRAFGYMLAAGSTGQTVASIIVPYIDWRLAFQIFGVSGLVWVLLWLFCYHESSDLQQEDEEQPMVDMPDIPPISKYEWICHWGLWAIYIAHFAMNWSNYIIMQWLPTYLSRALGAEMENLSLTAVPYIVSSVCGIVWGHFADLLVTEGWPIIRVRRIMTTIGLVGPGICLFIFPEVSSLSLALLIISFAMGLCSANSAGHLSNHADIASTHAGITFAISNTIATIPGILCGPLTAALVTASQGRWLPVFMLAAVVNFTASIIYYTQSSARAIL